MLEGCQVIGFDWRYLYVNDALVKHARKPREELLGRTMMEAYPGIENTEMFASLRKCMEERTPLDLENEFTFPDGATGWFELRAQAVPEGIFILSLDISSREGIRSLFAVVDVWDALSSDRPYRRLTPFPFLHPALIH